MFQPVHTRLLDELQRNLATRPKLLSVVAPIGYGKTVLMSELYAHLRRTGEHCYWIGLNERHASIDRVLDSLRRARGPETELDPTQALLQGDEPVERRIDELVELLADLPFSATIFIDNLNSCVDASLGAFLDALIFRTPPSVRFVWSSTTELAIDIGRSRLEGLVRQVGFADLSLNAEETRALLGSELDGHLGAAGAEAIRRQTEGWPAAVRMAQIVLSEAEQPRAALETFSGSDEDMAALLKRKVLSGFTPPLRDFMLCLAQLHTFNANLCREATGTAEAEAHLDFLLQRNVFMIPLDRNRKRYRLHTLFREYLLDEAERQLSAQRRREILERAAAWCEAHAEWHDAIEYALEAEAKIMARRLLDRTARIFVRERGNIPQYVQWVERLQRQGATLGWETQFWYVWALVFQRRHEYGLKQHGALAERYRQRTADDPPPGDLAQRIEHLRICIDLFTDRIADAYRGAEAWLGAHQSKNPYSIASIGCIKSLCLASSFKLPQARQTMGNTQPVLLEIGGADMVGWISLIQGTLLVYEGDYGRAYDELSTGLAQTRDRLGDDSVLCGTLALVAAKAAVEMQLDDEAHRLLAFGLRTVQNNVLVDTAACGFDAAVKLWQGGADETLSMARLHEVARSYPPRLALMLSCFLIRRLLQLGRLKEALVEAERIALDADADAGKLSEPEGEAFTIPRYRDLFAATAIDLFIATRQFKRAETLIATELSGARNEGRAARIVELELARAVVAVHNNDPTTAAKALTSAIRRAAQRRIIRPFHDRRETVAHLVEQRKTSSWSFALPEERSFFDTICQHFAANDAAAAATADAPPAGDARIALTAREAELLSLVDLGLSNQQIADRTQISVTTTKWHLKNLYKKFGVSTRTAALARARELALLDRQ